MNIEQLKSVIKALVENIINEHDRISTLQDRVLKLEMAHPEFLRNRK